MSHRFRDTSFIFHSHYSSFFHPDKCIHKHQICIYFTPFRLIFDLTNKILKFYIKKLVFWLVSIVHCLDASLSLMNGKREKRIRYLFFFEEIKGEPVESIQCASQSYYYFAIIFDLDPFRHQISHKTQLMKWHFDEYNNKRADMDAQENASLVKFDYLWYLLWIYINFSTMHTHYLLLIEYCLEYDDILKTMGTKTNAHKNQPISDSLHRQQ